ncbi:DUF2730 family protein [Vibrio algicola]|uniref:DUF2730 family protein n=1 Tax=Vibrio algicola TaxID=2662262 RepID=A0A5Q0TI51_9VIBR|nr:DUF2730 family protein [Vibrio algicola]
MDINDLKVWWPIVWAGVLSVVQVIQMLLSKTYAKREDLETANQKINKINNYISSLPTHDDNHKLRLEMEVTRGEIKELRAALKPVDHLTKLLLEKEMKE